MNALSTAPVSIEQRDRLLAIVTTLETTLAEFITPTTFFRKWFNTKAMRAKRAAHVHGMDARSLIATLKRIAQYGLSPSEFILWEGHNVEYRPVPGLRETLTVLKLNANISKQVYLSSKVIGEILGDRKVALEKEHQAALNEHLQVIRKTLTKSE